MSDCGRLQEGELVLFTGLGLARIKNVVSVRSTVDLKSILGRSMDGLGLQVPRHRRGVEVLCETCNMSRRLIDLGHLVLFNAMSMDCRDTSTLSQTLLFQPSQEDTHTHTHMLNERMHNSHCMFCFINCASLAKRGNLSPPVSQFHSEILYD